MEVHRNDDLKSDNKTEIESLTPKFFLSFLYYKGCKSNFLDFLDPITERVSEKNALYSLDVSRSTKQIISGLSNSDTIFLSFSRNIRYIVDVFTDRKMAVFYEAPKSVTDFDEIAKLISIKLLNEVSANENEEICSIILERKEKEYLFVGERFFRSIL